jgi:C_GCAxxG_C_C family probable redox protein
VVSKSEHAADQFRSGLNCTQAVVAAFAGDFEVDPDVACKMACGFGRGMARTGGTCGAVTGAIMVIGLATCSPSPYDSSSRARTFELVQAFKEEFQARHQATGCCELLGYDITTAEGLEEASRSDLFETRCPIFVEDAVEILEDIL